MVSKGDGITMSIHQSISRCVQLKPDTGYLICTHQTQVVVFTSGIESQH